jgi:hypothetical protein
MRPRRVVGTVRRIPLCDDSKPITREVAANQSRYMSKEFLASSRTNARANMSMSSTEVSSVKSPVPSAGGFAKWKQELGRQDSGSTTPPARESSISTAARETSGSRPTWETAEPSRGPSTWQHDDPSWESVNSQNWDLGDPWHSNTTTQAVSEPAPPPINPESRPCSEPRMLSHNPIMHRINQ